MDGAVRLLPPLLGRDSIVLSFQNGVESADMGECRRARARGRRHAYVAAAVTEPGVIRHTAMDHLIFGELDGKKSPRLERL
jgi:ketopantoate reductase